MAPKSTPPHQPASEVAAEITVPPAAEHELDARKKKAERLRADERRAQTCMQWMSTLPPDHAQLVKPENPPELTKELYRDYMNWADADLKTLLKEFEKHEMEYRRLGLKYHSIPHALRHANTNPHNALTVGGHPANLSNPATGRTPSPVNTAILQSLKMIFELDEPRTKNHFFMNWHDAQDLMELIHGLLATETTHTTVPYLRAVTDKIEHSVENTARIVDHIKTQLQGVARNLEEVCEKRKGAAAADLGQEHSIEGGLFRAWVSTFPEVVNGKEDLANVMHVLRIGGPELSMDWKGGDSKSGIEEGKPDGLGLLWEEGREHLLREDA